MSGVCSQAPEGVRVISVEVPITRDPYGPDDPFWKAVEKQESWEYHAHGHIADETFMKIRQAGWVCESKVRASSAGYAGPGYDDAVIYTFKRPKVEA